MIKKQYIRLQHTWIDSTEWILPCQFKNQVKMMILRKCRPIHISCSLQNDLLPMKSVNKKFVRLLKNSQNEMKEAVSTHSAE